MNEETNTEMGGDEVFLFLLSLVFFVVALFRWAGALRVAGRFRSRGWPLIFATPLVGLAMVLFVLKHWADDEVRADWRYIILLLLLGGAWMGMVSTVIHWWGVSMREDAAERRNIAATVAWCGTMLGVIALYSGGNTGEGPSLWNNVFSAGLGTATLLAFWLVLQWTARISHSITIDRDVASGVRIAGFMLACGIVFGRALAGDWQSAAHTADDFIRDGWITGPVLVVAVIVELLARPTPKNPRPSWFAFGLVPAAIYLAAAAAWVKWIGPWK
jgi:uncharacterized membrane protein YjfL (UPF0719 family)